MRYLNEEKEKQREEEEEIIEEDEDFNLDVVENEIFFSGDITTNSMHELIVCAKKLEKKILKTNKRKITLYIRSDGGEYFAGMSAMDHLRRLKVNLVTVADGFCASAATFLLMGSKTRRIMPHAHLLIHQITAGALGKYEDMKDEMKNCNKLMKALKEIYRENTNLPEDKLEKLMKKDIYFTADDCEKWDIAKKKL